MAATETREHILTDNEKYGSGFLTGDEGGVWIILYRPGTAESHVSHVYNNRQACEDYIYARCAGHPGCTREDYSIQVWAIEDHFNPEDA